jgi:hypothetical protein
VTICSWPHSLSFLQEGQEFRSCVSKTGSLLIAWFARKETQCVSHRGRVAFSLLTYADAVKRASRIAEETVERHIRPWLPERGEFPIR